MWQSGCFLCSPVPMIFTLSFQDPGHPTPKTPDPSPRKNLLSPNISLVPKMDVLTHLYQLYVRLTPKYPDTRWWFQIFFIFTPIWGRFPIWLMFFQRVETTKQDKVQYTSMFGTKLLIFFLKIHDPQLGRNPKSQVHPNKDILAGHILD